MPGPLAKERHESPGAIVSIRPVRTRPARRTTAGPHAPPPIPSVREGRAPTCFRRKPNSPTTKRRKAAISSSRISGSLARHQPDDRRIHLGRRVEGASRHREEPLDRRHRLDSDGQRAVLLAPGSGRDPLGDFLLHQEDDAPGPRRPERLVDQGRGDVVGDVADDGEGPARQPVPVLLERIALDDGRPPETGRGAPEPCRGPARSRSGGAPRAASCAVSPPGPGADLEHGLAGQRGRAQSAMRRRMPGSGESAGRAPSWAGSNAEDEQGAIVDRAR